MRCDHSSDVNITEQNMQYYAEYYTSPKDADENFNISRAWKWIDPEYERWILTGQYALKHCFITRLSFDESKKPYVINRVVFEGLFTDMNIQGRFKKVIREKKIYILNFI